MDYLSFEFCFLFFVFSGLSRLGLGLLKSPTQRWQGVYALFPTGDSCRLKVVNDLAQKAHRLIKPRAAVAEPVEAKPWVMNYSSKLRLISFLYLTTMADFPQMLANS
jgi:hypothetical protein